MYPLTPITRADCRAYNALIAASRRAERREHAANILIIAGMAILGAAAGWIMGYIVFEAMLAI